MTTPETPGLRRAERRAPASSASPSPSAPARRSIRPAATASRASSRACSAAARDGLRRAADRGDHRRARRRDRGRRVGERHQRPLRGHPPLARPHGRSRRRRSSRSPTFDEGELGAPAAREPRPSSSRRATTTAALASRAFRRTLFAGHPYGRRVAGTIATLRAIGEGDVRAFYARHFARAQRRRRRLRRRDRGRGPRRRRAPARRPARGRARSPTRCRRPRRAPGRHLVFVDKPERTQTQILIGGLGTDAHDPDHVPLVVANTVFGGTFTSRLMQEVRAKRGWSYGASSRVGFDRQRDAFTMWTAPAAERRRRLPRARARRSCTPSATRASRRRSSTFVKRYLVRSHAFEIDTARKRVHQTLEAELFDLPAGLPRALRRARAGGRPRRGATRPCARGSRRTIW